MTKRFRPLDEVENRNHDWVDFNSLFGELTPIVTGTLNRGVRTDLDCYVPTRTNFEYKFCNEHLGLDRRSATHKIHILKGQVGRGKSTFVDYCRHKLIPELYSKTVITFFMDLEGFVTQEPYKELERRFISTIEDKLLLSCYNESTRSFKTEFVRFLDFKTSNESEITSIYAKEISLSNLIRFVDLMQLDRSLNSKNKSGGVLIILDNVDENPMAVISSCASFVHNLLNKCHALCTNKVFTILVTVRDYNTEIYYQTAKYPISDMRPVNITELIKRRIDILRERLEASYRKKTRTLEYSIYAEVQKFQARTVTVTEQNLIPFLKGIVDALFSSHDNEVVQLFEDLAGGNLKVIIANVFNLLMSSKLPLLDLFKKHFLVPEMKEYQITEPFKIEIVLECLLAVHQPFYSAKESLIMNLFNCANSDAENDFHDVLIIPRILFFTYNTPHPTIRIIRGKFRKYKYTKDNVERALTKCFKYGLFETSYGVKPSQLDPIKAKLSLSCVGRVYLEHILKQVTYYQYVCEDTYLPPGYVPIRDKYPSKNGEPGSKKLRIEGAKQLVEFIKSQEKIELNFIKNELKLDIDNYLANYSFRYKGQGMTITEFLDRTVSPNLEILLKNNR